MQTWLDWWDRYDILRESGVSKAKPPPPPPWVPIKLPIDQAWGMTVNSDVDVGPQGYKLLDQWKQMLAQPEGKDGIKVPFGNTERILRNDFDIMRALQELEQIYQASGYPKGTVLRSYEPYKEPTTKGGGGGT